MAEHCPGCHGYTAGWQDECPGLPAREDAKPARRPMDFPDGHEITHLGRLLDRRCHCRWGEPHDVGEPYPQ